MNNISLLKDLIDNYNYCAYTHNYMFGFVDKGVVYCAIATSEVMPYVCKIDKASRGAGYALRFCPTVAQKEMLKGYELFRVCSKDYFNEVCATSKYNRGEIFEKMVTEYFGQEWKKDNVPFTKSGDIVINKVHYQIKFEKATFTTEKTLAHLLSK